MDRSSFAFVSCLVLSGMLGVACYKVKAAWSAQVARTEEIVAAQHRLEGRLSASLNCAGAVAATASGAPVLAAVAPSDPESLAHANALVDDAVLHHLWGSGHAQSMRALLPHLSEGDKQVVLHRFTSAANGGQMDIRTPGQPPF